MPSLAFFTRRPSVEVVCAQVDLGPRDRTRERKLGWTALLVLAGALASAPAPAIAAGATPTVSVNQRCYANARSNAAMTISGAGWTAGDTVQISGAEEPITATVAPDGTFTAPALAPSGNFGLRQESKALSVTETDATTGQPVSGATAQVSFLVTDLALSVSPQNAPFNRKVTFRFSGFTAGRPIYAHYLRGRRVVARQRFGTASGPCGLLKKRTLQYPGGHPGARRYTVQFDGAQHYNRHTLPRIVVPLTVIRY